LTDSIRKKIAKILADEFKEDLAFGISNLYKEKGKKQQLISVTLSHWGKPRFWTSKLLVKVMKTGLKLDHFEAVEETVVMAVFELK